MNVAAPVLDILAEQSHRLAVGDSTRRGVCYGALERQIVALARRLAAEGLQPGDRVLVQVPNGPLFAASALSVLLLGGVPVLAEPGLGEAVYRSRIRAAAPRWLLVHPLVLGVHHAPRARRALAGRDIHVPPVPEAIPHRLVLTARRLQAWARALPSGASVDPVDLPETAEGVLVFTGGTTDAPRGVQLSHGALDRYLARIATVIQHEHVEHFLADTPQQVLYALRLGRTAYVTRGRKARRAARVLSLIRAGTVDAYFGSPYVWVQMMALAGPARQPLPPSLRTVLLGSAPVTPAFLRELRAWLHPDTRVLTLYGLTEAGPVCVADLEDKLAWEARGEPGDYVGRPLPGVQVTIQAPEPTCEKAATKAEVGEVLVLSDSLYSGYLGEPPRPADAPLHTGDLGRLVDRGDGIQGLVLLGRSKDMIIRRGVNLYPATLEPLLGALRRSDGTPWLQEAVLVGVWDPATQDERVVLVGVPARAPSEAPAGRPDPAALRRAAAETLGPDGAPDHVLLLPELPVVGRQNKVDKAALRRRAAETLGLVPARPAAAPGPSPSPRARDHETPPEVEALAPHLRRKASVRVPYNFSNFARKYALLARSEGLWVALCQASLRLGLWAVGQAGWAADTVLSPTPLARPPEPGPGYAPMAARPVPYLGPLFILGHQRSGTTFLHRLLSADKTHARPLLLHEMLLPATSIQRSIAALARADAWLLGGRLRAEFHALEERLFGPLDPIHRLRLGEVEEDEFVFWALFEGIMCANDAPASTATAALEDLRDFATWSPERQARALTFYRACIEKKLGREPPISPGVPVWPLAKNPAFTQRILALRAVFPGARFVYLLRNPLEAIPSRLNLIRAIWRRRFPGFDELSPAHVETLVRDSVRTYLAAERLLPTLDSRTYLTIRHETLRADPRGVVARIYRHFDLPAPDAHLEAALAAAEAKAAAHCPRPAAHRLSEFGLDPDALRRRLAPVFEHHGF